MGRPRFLWQNVALALGAAAFFAVCIAAALAVEESFARGIWIGNGFGAVAATGMAIYNVSREVRG